jgi:hypothetical protein
MFLWKFLSILRSPGISPQNIPNGKPFQSPYPALVSKWTAQRLSNQFYKSMAFLLECWSDGVMEHCSNLGFMSFLLDHNTPILHSSSTPIEIFLGKPIHSELRAKVCPTNRTRRGASRNSASGQRPAVKSPFCCLVSQATWNILDRLYLMNLSHSALIKYQVMPELISLVFPKISSLQLGAF